ncbi:hypothetical protein [Pseudogemmobacter bohemicus]|uniref:hypothetical protein n=1 Tax=Pseudogemmobacter bohemicus TaxID=2250708 RepID=UPI000DD462DD|nr:hypothetical protein [Pseudogemmobacter bohemicus]
MIWKIILIFLCAMALVGMIGKVMFPNARMLRGRPARGGKCQNCGRPLIGRGPCDCRKARK